MHCALHTSKYAVSITYVDRAVAYTRQFFETVSNLVSISLANKNSWMIMNIKCYYYELCATCNNVLSDLFDFFCSTICSTK